MSNSKKGKIQSKEKQLKKNDKLRGVPYHKSIKINYQSQIKVK
jgi:hypothetical protein